MAFFHGMLYMEHDGSAQIGTIYPSFYTHEDGYHGCSRYLYRRQ